jgi:flagellar biogenesis protein FliO
MDAARQAISVLFVLALLGAALWTLRRGTAPWRGMFAQRSREKTKSVQSLERVSLTPQHSLHLVRAGGRDWLLVTHPQGCTVVSNSAATGAAE